MSERGSMNLFNRRVIKLNGSDGLDAAVPAVFADTLNRAIVHAVGFAVGALFGARKLAAHTANVG